MNPGLISAAKHTLSIIALSFCLMSLTAGSALAEGRVTQVPAPHSILFVGNSFTFYNDSLHTHVRRMLAGTSSGELAPGTIKSMTISGARLEEHKVGLQLMLDRYHWDVVVMQGHSLEAIDPRQAETFRATVSEFAGMVGATGSTPVLFMTWAYSDRPDMPAELEQAYSSIGDELGILVVPVGLAFAQARLEIPGINLYNADAKHPSLEGTYLAACVFWSALYARSPAGSAYTAGIDESVARNLQAVAWSSVQSYYGMKP